MVSTLWVTKKIDCLFSFALLRSSCPRIDNLYNTINIAVGGMYVTNDSPCLILVCHSARLHIRIASFWRLKIRTWFRIGVRTPVPAIQWTWPATWCSSNNCPWSGAGHKRKNSREVRTEKLALFSFVLCSIWYSSSAPLHVFHPAFIPHFPSFIFVDHSSFFKKSFFFTISTRSYYT